MTRLSRTRMSASRSAAALRLCLPLLVLPIALVAADADALTATAASAAPATGFAAFWEAFVTSFMVIVATELGDKTFFIAAIMAMRHSRFTVWAGAAGALAVMTVLSTAVGHVAPMLLPPALTHYAAVCLFAVFGVRMLRESRGASSAASDELEEVEAELEKKEEDVPADEEAAAQTEAAAKSESKKQKILLQAFTLTFLAEWGDRSQIATIALAAAKEPFGITLGATIGHACCTGLAVIGGKLLASRISERMVRAPPPRNQYRQPTQMPRGCRPLARPPPSMTTMITTTTAPCAHRCLCRAARSSSSLPSARSSRARAQSRKPSTAQTAGLCSTQSICLRALMCGTSHIYPV